jgi:hypothetical protein
VTATKSNRPEGADAINGIKSGVCASWEPRQRPFPVAHFALWHCYFRTIIAKRSLFERQPKWPSEGDHTDLRKKSQTLETGPNGEKVKDYRHEEERPNNPPAGLATYDRTEPSRKIYDYDPHLDPQLIWAGKKEHTSFEVENVALHIHERISTAAIVKAV